MDLEKSILVAKARLLLAEAEVSYNESRLADSKRRLADAEEKLRLADPTIPTDPANVPEVALHDQLEEVFKAETLWRAETEATETAVAERDRFAAILSWLESQQPPV